MSYEPHTWVNGETITAEKMNNLEEGVSSGGGGGGAMIVQYNHSTGALDKTVRELNTALLSGVPVYFVYVYGPVEYQSTSDSYEGNTFLYRIGSLKELNEFCLESILRSFSRSPSTLIPKS